MSDLIAAIAGITMFLSATIFWCSGQIVRAIDRNTAALDREENRADDEEEEEQG